MARRSSALDALLARAPQLWRGREPNRGQSSLPSGHARLDARLPGGGWPIGAVTELIPANPGLGEFSLLFPALATLGRYATLARFSTLQLVLTVAMSIAAAPYGLVAVAGAYVARAYLMLPLQMWAFKRYSGLGYGEILRSVAPAFATSALMAAAVVSLDAVKL